MFERIRRLVGGEMSPLTEDCIEWSDCKHERYMEISELPKKSWWQCVDCGKCWYKFEDVGT